MQNKGKNGNFFSSCSFVFFSIFFLLFTCCKHSLGKVEKTPSGGNKTQTTNTEFYHASVKYRSFQNPDSTWGYTIIVDSRPYLHYSRIPYKSKGFPLRKEAEIVAGILTKMIQNGDPNPKLSKKLIDSLDLQMKLIETSIGR
jgi:hypothetical protein